MGSTDSSGLLPICNERAAAVCSAQHVALPCHATPQQATSAAHRSTLSCCVPPAMLSSTCRGSARVVFFVVNSIANPQHAADFPSWHVIGAAVWGTGPRAVRQPLQPHPTLHCAQLSINSYLAVEEVGHALDVLHQLAVARVARKGRKHVLCGAGGQQRRKGIDLLYHCMECGWPGKEIDCWQGPAAPGILMRSLLQQREPACTPSLLPLPTVHTPFIPLWPAIHTTLAAGPLELTWWYKPRRDPKGLAKSNITRAD